MINYLLNGIKIKMHKQFDIINKYIYNNWFYNTLQNIESQIKQNASQIWGFKKNSTLDLMYRHEKLSIIEHHSSHLVKPPR